EFVRKGGGLIIADDFREGDSVSKCFGIEFSKKLLLEPSSFSKQPSFPIINVTLGGRTCSMMLNYPSTLVLRGRFVGGRYLARVDEHEIECNLSILARSSKVSWLDLDCDFNRDEREPRSSFPLIALLEYGEGRVVVISDPDLFINDMIWRFDNPEVVSFILDYVSANSSPTFYFMEERVWRIKPLFFYFITIAEGWENLSLLSRLFFSSIAICSVFLAMLYVTASLAGYPLFTSILGVFGGTEEEFEELSFAFRQEAEREYGEYLLPLFERVFDELREELGIDIPSEAQRIADLVKARHPSLDASLLRRLMERYDYIVRGGRISDFRTFARIFDDLMALSRELGVEWY
ncbi:MAG: hypothetical protein DRO05_04235, partial [Thermoproteota archaeon]